MRTTPKAATLKNRIGYFFQEQPTEEIFLDAIIYKESLIREKYKTTQLWRECQSHGTSLRIKHDDATQNVFKDVLIKPYSPDENPDLVLSNFFDRLDDPIVHQAPAKTNVFGDRIIEDSAPSEKKETTTTFPSRSSGNSTVDPRLIKGTWLTEPSTRRQIPALFMRITYFSIGFTIGAFLVGLICWLWYFFLERISELSKAIRGGSH